MPTSFTSASATRAVSDAALIQGIRERRQEALGALYDRHAPLLLALARRILDSLAEGEEVLQEVFLHVWNRAERYDPARSSVPTWLALLTRSRAIDRLRSRRVSERTHEAAHSEGGGDHTSPEGVETVFQEERRQRIQQELARLPSEQRQVLEMAFYGGLSQTEIAGRTSLPLGTVKTRTLLAMKKLRGALRDDIRQLL